MIQQKIRLKQMADAQLLFKFNMNVALQKLVQYMKANEFFWLKEEH